METTRRLSWFPTFKSEVERVLTNKGVDVKSFDWWPNK